MPSGLPPDKGGIGHTIPTGDSPPVAKPGYRLRIPTQCEGKEGSRRGNGKPFWKESLFSPAIFRKVILYYLWFVDKKDGGLRMCVDFRTLNNVTVKNKFLIPLVDDLLDRLGGAEVFRPLDLQSGYHQIQIAE